MGANKEVWQRRSLRSASTPIDEKRLPRKKGSLIGDRLSFEHGFRQPRVEVLDSRIASRNLSVDDRVDDQTKAVSRTLHCRGRPAVPARILRREIEQDVAVDHHGRHYSPRVRAIISSVVIPTLALPRKWATMRAPL